MNIKILSIAILASLLCLSCADSNLETTAQSNKTSSKETLHTYDADIEAGTFNPDNAPAIAKMENMKYKITDDNYGGKTGLCPKLNITSQTMPSLLVFYNKTTETKKFVEANWKVFKSGTKIGFLLEKLSIYADLEQGEWYLMAFMGGGQKVGDKLNVTLDTNAKLIKKDQEITASCPFATTWRRVVMNGNRLKLAQADNRMMFKPQGVFLVLDVESRMSLNTKLDRNVRLESNAFCSAGSYEFDINKETMTDDADRLSEYWKPDNHNRINNAYPNYIAANGEQYVTRFKLNYQSDFYDGTETNGKSALKDYMYFRKKNHLGAQETKPFLLCLMPVDYTKTATQNPYITTEALFYGSVFIDDDTRTNYTYARDTYKEDPSTWKPYMESRYLLGSFSNNLAKGSCHRMRLRIVRPTLPIERLWAYRQGLNGEPIPMKVTNRSDAEDFSEGKTDKDRASYPGLTNGKYRFPKYSELIPIFNNPTKELEAQTRIGKINTYNTNEEYGFAIAIRSHKNWVNINGKHLTFDNWFCHQKGSTDTYGIMYIKPFGSTEETSGNYKVAYRMSYENATKPEGNATIQVYYLGPNYNLSNAVAGFYCCHAGFWDPLTNYGHDIRSIIERKYPLGGDYWLSDKEPHGEGETKSLYNSFNFNGEADPPNKSASWRKWSFFLPWLKAPAW